MPEEKLIETQVSSLSWNMISEMVEKLFPGSSTILKVVLAVSLSLKIPGNKVWLLIVGNPSSSKTEMVCLINLSKHVYYLDSMTANPFAPGYIGKNSEKTFDLLPEINDKIFICKEYSAIFNLNCEVVKKLLGELVAIYDGEFSKFSPTRGKKNYKSLFPHIGCITPVSLHKHEQYMNIIGPRFLFFKVNELDEIKKQVSYENIWEGTEGKIQENIKKTRELVSQYLDSLMDKIGNDPTITFSKNTIKFINILAEFISRGRAIIIGQRDSFIKEEEEKEVHYYDIQFVQKEEPFRALKQLRSLITCLMFINGTNQITNDDFNLLKHIAFSSMPIGRGEIMKIFSEIYAGEPITTKTIAERYGKSRKTVQRSLKELTCVKILRCDPNPTDKTEYLYKPMPEFEMLFNHAMPTNINNDIVDDEVEINEKNIKELFPESALVKSDIPF